MQDYECWEIKGRTLEYLDDIHLYLVDGVPVKSVTQLIGYKFKDEYKDVDAEVLKQASVKGTAIHKAIEDYCTKGIESDVPELKGFKTLQKLYKFDVLANEVPVILEDKQGIVIGAGRLDIVMEMGGKIGGADIKRTYTLNKEKLGYQLNLYRIAYRQSYGTEWEFLKGIHLREYIKKLPKNDGDVIVSKELKRQMVDIPINEDFIWKYLEELKDAGKISL